MLTREALEQEIIHYTKETNLLAYQIKTFGSSAETEKRAQELVAKYYQFQMLARVLGYQ